MKTNSNNLPDKIQPFGVGKSLINYAVKTVEKQVMHGEIDKTIGYEYESVMLIGEPTIEAITSAIINDKYPLAAEIAIINNFNIGEKLAEYEAYQHFRRIAKFVASKQTITTQDEISTIA